jgi:protein-S-isoprenylcysteine O-methyltransferase Ste14
MSLNGAVFSEPSLRQMIFGDGTPKKAILTALVVGSLLTAINHGDVILSDLPPPPWKVILTYCVPYCVPYCVTTWGAITGKRAQWHRYERSRGSAEWSEDR